MAKWQQPNPPVWVATLRDGIDFHAGESGAFILTACHRSTGAGVVIRMDEALALNAKPCIRCVAVKFDRAW